MVEDRPGRDWRELGQIGIAELELPKGIAVEPAGHRIETIGKGRPRVRREPTLADQELTSQCVVNRHLRTVVVPHHRTLNDAIGHRAVRGNLVEMLGEASDETIELAAV